MKIAFVIGTIGAMMIAGQAMAQVNSTAAQSANSSRINIQTGSVSTTPANTNVHYSGQTNTPDVSGALLSGANPCLVGAGVSVATMGTGVGLSWGHDSSACERRQDAAALYSVGVGTHNELFVRAALDRLCDGHDIRHALEAEGYVCPDDRKEHPTAVPVAVVLPTPVAVQAPPAKPVRPDWCETVAPSERTAHTRAVCGN